MSEPIPEAIPTSNDRRSNRPVKKARANDPLSQQSAQVEALFANPDREIIIPASATSQAKTLAAPPEIVANVQGSSAGAGSGEFHVYKASRRREYERLRLMDEEVEKEEKEKEWREKQEERRKLDEEKLSKNQLKRAKAKLRKERKKIEGGGDGEGMEVDGAKDDNGVEKKKKKLAPAKSAVQSNGGHRDEDDATDGNENRDATEEGGITFHDDD
ncbi:hypothetical protein BDY17DRAFT_255861 [Neohortaea acidophila]|uniref:DUF1168 domain protein n=1 Tax=Neohortaea acidophila TaxID=245834 RepID=A0A6A6PKI3_9PEZI|nr:uncharacterized protein BDY17DRAFT_255861 [Neohortaea acidophila]KAF2480316.1 hypothetical protein BDY17DRAFT_255861 [Neohortaea acidophila]